MLRLSERELEKIADFRIVRSLVDRKLGQPLASLVVLADGVAVIGMLVCFVLASNTMVHRTTGALERDEIALLAVATVCAVFLLAREAVQAKAMARIKLFGSWASDPWNALDVIDPIAVLSVVGVAAFGGDVAREANAFRIGVAFSSFLTWCVGGVAFARTSARTSTARMRRVFVGHDLCTFPLIRTMSVYRTRAHARLLCPLPFLSRCLVVVGALQAQSDRLRQVTSC